MVINPVRSILRAATRSPDEPLNILCAPTHERFETGLAKTGHRFWAIRCPQVKGWNQVYAPVPSNYVLLNPERGENQIPPEVSFDLVLSQNKFGQYNILSEFAKQLHVPLISLEHTLPVPTWPGRALEQLKAMKGHVNVFISEFSRKAWGWAEDEADVVHHGVETGLFVPHNPVENRNATVLSVVNDWINRDIFCGYRLWAEASKGLPTVVVGDTPGLSKPAVDTADLVSKYNSSRVFLNTSLVSPIPTSLLEAMSCGCAVVSTATCMIPEIIKQGGNGFLSNDPAELKAFCSRLLSNRDLARKMGQAARQTIVERFGMDAFVGRWRQIFAGAAKITFVG